MLLGHQSTGGGFYGKNIKDLKSLKLDVIVIRVNSLGNLVNSRPCYNCLKMMKELGINKIYYSTEDGIKHEKIKYMASICASAAQRSFELKYLQIKLSEIEYYELLLKKYFPEFIKIENLQLFIKYNLINCLPNHKVIISKNKFKLLNNSNLIIQSNIIE